MSSRYVSYPWTLPCPWCEFYIYVNNRGQRGSDDGAGVEAANLMQDHAERTHGRTWDEYLAATVPTA